MSTDNTLTALMRATKAARRRLDGLAVTVRLTDDMAHFKIEFRDFEQEIGLYLRHLDEADDPAALVSKELDRWVDALERLYA